MQPTGESHRSHFGFGIEKTTKQAKQTPVRVHRALNDQNTNFSTGQQGDARFFKTRQVLINSVNNIQLLVGPAFQALACLTQQLFDLAPGTDDF